MQVDIKTAPAVQRTPRGPDQGGNSLIDQSLAHPAHPSTPIEKVAELAEREISRLRRARPELDTRISRAENLLVAQFSVRNGSRPIRVQVHPDGDHSYVVRSGSKLSRVYTINPHTWGCSCPDHVRRDAACKHTIAAWVLERVYKASAPPQRSTCAACGQRYRHRELCEVGGDNLTFFEGDLLCRDCARAHGVL